jgi:hypothetical protein
MIMMMMGTMVTTVTFLCGGVRIGFFRKHRAVEVAIPRLNRVQRQCSLYRLNKRRREM